MQDDAEIGLVLLGFLIELATDSYVTIILDRGLRPFQDAYGTQTSNGFKGPAPCFSFFFLFPSSCPFSFYEPWLMPRENIIFSQLWAQNSEPFFLFLPSLGSQRIPVVRARSCINGKLGKPLRDETRLAEVFPVGWKESLSRLCKCLCHTEVSK